MDGERTAAAFTQRLAALKRRGAGLLVVGATGDGSHLELSRRLLGDSRAGARRRALVLIDGRGGPEDRIPEGERGSDQLRVVDRRPLTRGATAAASGSAPTPVDIEAVERESLAAIDGLEAAADGFATSELRLCLDSLRPLIDRHGTAGTEPLVRSLLDRVRGEQGIAHVHLPVPYDTDVVREMADPFDAVIELRPGEQRWHVPEEPIHSEWLPVDRGSGV
jgi:hypothetical protein